MEVVGGVGGVTISTLLKWKLGFGECKVLLRVVWS